MIPPDRRAALIRWSGILAAAVGVLALVGWASGWRWLASWLPGSNPMPPSTAVLLVLFGALGAGVPRFERRGPRAPVAALALLGTAVAALVLVTSARADYFDLEQPGVDSLATVAGAPVGHMSPVTAVCFLLAGAAIALLVGTAHLPRWAPFAAFIAAAGIVLVAAALAMAYVVGGPGLYGSGRVPSSLPTAVALGALGLGLAVAGREAASSSSAAARPAPARRGRSALIAVLLVACGAIVGGAYLFSRASLAEFREQAEASLESIAELKVSELTRWRMERRGDGEVLFGNQPFELLVRRALAEPADPESRGALRDWLEHLFAAYDYDRLSLFDARGVERMSVPAGAGPDAATLASEAVEAAEAGGEVRLVDFHRHAPGAPVELAVLVPVRDASDAAGVQAVLAMHIRADSYLYPLLERWPTPSRTAETLLVRREGDAVVFLNDLRFRPGAALELELALARDELPVVKAVRGEVGVVEGRDHRGVEVLAALAPVPDSPWFLVTHMDHAEIFAPLRERLRWALLSSVGLLLVVTAGVAWAWQREEKIRYRSLARSEAARRASEERYHELFESIRDAVLVIDGRQRIVDANHAFSELFGWPVGEVRGEGLGLLLADDGELGRIEEALRRDSAESGIVSSVECRTRAGETFLAEAGVLVRREERRHLGHVLLIRDVSHRRRAEEALQRSEEMQRAIIAASPVALYTLDPDGRVSSWNDSAERILGWSRDEVLGRSLPSVPGDRREEAAELMARGLAGEVATGIETVRRRKDGGSLPCSLSVAPILDPEGRVVSVLVTLEDATERRRAEEERQRLRRELEQAQKLESVGRLAGGVAHDFNNMLGVILGHAELALEDAEPGSRQAEDLEEIRRAAERSAALTRQLLAFARRETIAPEVVDLDEEIEGMLRMLRRLLAAGIELSWEPAADGVWPVRVDRSQLQQVVINLCVNASDAIGERGRVRIGTANVRVDEPAARARLAAEPGEYVRLTVSDDGCGMDEETLAQIFEPFFTTKAVGEGTGLGLSTVYGIVRQNGGFVDVESEPGEGTTLAVHLPRWQSGEAEVEEPASAVAPPTPSTGGETILLVEDEPSVLRLAERILVAEGYRVLAAATPREALALARRGEEIDLLVTDVVMPDLSGHELTKRLRRDRPDLPAVYVSGYSGDVVGRHGVLAEEGLRLVHKPFSRDELTRAVREVLDG